MIYSRDEWKCRHCGNRSTLTPHHVTFRSAGGGDESSNILTLCMKCHDDVHGGRLTIWVRMKTPTNLVVRFIHEERWKP
jgi:5-methylcytosine-specific restriction endonuclease McrA